MQYLSIHLDGSRKFFFGHCEFPSRESSGESADYSNSKEWQKISDLGKVNWLAQSIGRVDCPNAASNPLNAHAEGSFLSKRPCGLLFSRDTSLMLPNGVTVGYGVDNDSHITGLTYSAGNSQLGNLTYGYVCQAISEGMAILTPDQLIRQYPVRTIW